MAAVGHQHFRDEGQVCIQSSRNLIGQVVIGNGFREIRIAHDLPQGSVYPLVDEEVAAEDPVGQEGIHGMLDLIGVDTGKIRTQQIAVGINGLHVAGKADRRILSLFPADFLCFADIGFQLVGFPDIIVVQIGIVVIRIILCVCVDDQIAVVAVGTVPAGIVAHEQKTRILIHEFMDDFHGGFIGRIVRKNHFPIGKGLGNDAVQFFPDIFF